MIQAEREIGGGGTRDTKGPTSSEGFVLIFSMLAVSSAVSTAIGWFNSGDVKGWWQLLIAVYLLLDSLYATVFVLIARFGRSFGLGFMVAYNAALGLALVVHSLMFYLISIDWLSVNSGKIALSPLEKAVQSNAAIYAIYALFLIVAAILALMRRLRHG